MLQYNAVKHGWWNIHAVTRKWVPTPLVAENAQKNTVMYVHVGSGWGGGKGGWEGVWGSDHDDYGGGLVTSTPHPPVQ